jgi:hypothetical protein
MYFDIAFLIHFSKKNLILSKVLLTCTPYQSDMNEIILHYENQINILKVKSN